MNSTVKERDYFFDNYRFLLIFLVVVGHFIEPCFRNHPMLSILKGIIFSFHMPVFFILAGYTFRPKPWRELLSGSVPRLRPSSAFRT